MKRVYTPVPHNCVRCWHCCIETNYPAQGNPRLERQLLLQWIHITELGNLRICPLLTVHPSGLPACIIYHERPLVCRMYHCEVQQSVKVQPLRQTVCCIK